MPQVPTLQLSSEAVDVALDQAMIEIATGTGEPWKTGPNLS